MSDHTSSSLRLRAASVLGVAFVVFGVLWLLILSFGSSDETATVSAERSIQQPEASSWVMPQLVDSDLESGSKEFSAVAFNESTGRLLIADDEGWFFEYDLGGDGTPIVPPRRTIEVAVGGGDVEGVAWMFGSTYAVAHENDGRLTIVEIADTATVVGDVNMVRTVDTGIAEDGGNGLEGVTYLGRGVLEFAVIDERPPTLHLVDSSGDVQQVVALDLGVPDVSDVWARADGTFVVLSDEARLAVTIAVDSAGSVAVLETLSLEFDSGRFDQPEGVVGTLDGERLFVVGEAPSSNRFSFGVWRSEPVG